MLKGDILYLRAVTTTGAVAHIVASTKGFYVCRSTDTVFKPTESSTRPCRSHTLVGTLSSYCPVFKARFNALLKPSADRPTLELLLTPCQINPWMIGREAHEMDELRAENAASIWSEADPLNPGMIRDWNDDLQNLRELYNDFDIILDHFSRMSQPRANPPRAACCALLCAHACWVLMDAVPDFIVIICPKLVTGPAWTMPAGCSGTGCSSSSTRYGNFDIVVDHYIWSTLPVRAYFQLQ